MKKNDKLQFWDFCKLEHLDVSTASRRRRSGEGLRKSAVKAVKERRDLLLFVCVCHDDNDIERTINRGSTPLNSTLFRQTYAMYNFKSF